MLLSAGCNQADIKTSASKQWRIWETALLIPKGKVISYGQLADFAGLPGRARLVGRAMAQAPVEMNVPWFRVLRADGKLAFAAGSSQALRQRELLIDEGVAVVNNRVAMKTFGWQPDLSEMISTLKY